MRRHLSRLTVTCFRILCVECFVHPILWSLFDLFTAIWIPGSKLKVHFQSLCQLWMRPAWLCSVTTYFLQLFSRSIHDPISMLFAFAIDQLANCSGFATSGLVQLYWSLWSIITATLQTVEPLFWLSVWASLVMYQPAQGKSFYMCVWEAPQSCWSLCVPW